MDYESGTIAVASGAYIPSVYLAISETHGFKPRAYPVG